MTIKDILEYVMTTPWNSNPNVLKPMLASLQEGDNVDISFVDAAADKILVGYKGVDKNGNKVEGTCSFNAELPSAALNDNIVFGSEPGQYYLVKINGEWKLRQRGNACTVNNVQYDTIAEAFNDVESGATITLAKDSESAGLGLWENNEKEIVLDLNGHTLTVTGPAVGSSKTQTQAAHFEKGSKVTIKNGTIAATSTQLSNVKMGIQNYADLTLENVILDFSQNPGVQYVVSNNFGSLTVKGNTQIIAAEGQCAFDLWFGLNSQGLYDDGVNVTFDDDFTGRVVGRVEYGAQNATRVPEWKDRTKLTIKAGTFDGPIVKSSNNFNLEDANIEITGGTFTSDTWDQFK